MEVSVISDNQVENFIKFLKLNDGKIIELYAFMEEFIPSYSRKNILYSKDFALKTEVVDGDLVISDQLTIPHEYLRTLNIFERGYGDFCAVYRNDEESIHYTINFTDTNYQPFNKPECINFFRDDKDFSHEYIECLTGVEKEYMKTALIENG